MEVGTKTREWAVEQVMRYHEKDKQAGLTFDAHNVVADAKILVDYVGIPKYDREVR